MSNEMFEDAMNLQIGFPAKPQMRAAKVTIEMEDPDPPIVFELWASDTPRRTVVGFDIVNHFRDASNFLQARQQPSGEHDVTLTFRNVRFKRDGVDA